jgi:hypothetical protein
MYFCYFRVVQSDPNGFGNPVPVAQSIANDIINIAAPSACTTNPAEPWCFGDLGVTQGCAKHPAQFFYYCPVPQPPNPIKTPMTWVQEAEKCNGNFTLAPDAQQALLAYVRPQAPGLVVSMADFTCLSQQGDAFYQATFQVAAGASLDIFGGSKRIVDLLEGQRTTLCTDPDPSKRPLYCRNPPLGGNNICARDQYDPQNVLVCPFAPGNMAMTFAVPNCDCGASRGDTDLYKTHILQWVSDVTRTQNKINVRSTIEEYKCVQQGSTCQYQYRVRCAPADANTDGYAAIQILAAQVNAFPQPCTPDGGANVYDFCSPAGAYWESASACAQIWDRASPLLCEV